MNKLIFLSFLLFHLVGCSDSVGPSSNSISSEHEYTIKSEQLNSASKSQPDARTATISESGSSVQYRDTTIPEGEIKRTLIANDKTFDISLRKEEHRLYITNNDKTTQLVQYIELNGVLCDLKVPPDGTSLSPKATYYTNTKQCPLDNIRYIVIYTPSNMYIYSM